jgi:hypothetical protein
MKKPNKDEYALFYHTYVEKVPDGDIIKTLSKQTLQIKNLLKNVSKKKSMHRYSPDKWSILEVTGHIIEIERVFSYRALRFARNDSQPLPGFDENSYIKQSNYNNVKLSDLIKEFCSLREANILMFKNTSEEMSLRQGIANGNKFTVRALAYIMAGHVNHHLKILKQRYL